MSAAHCRINGHLLPLRSYSVYHAQLLSILERGSAQLALVLNGEKCPQNAKGVGGPLTVRHTKILFAGESSSKGITARWSRCRELRREKENRPKTLFLHYFFS